VQKVGSADGCVRAIEGKLNRANLGDDCHPFNRRKRRWRERRRTFWPGGEEQRGKRKYGKDESTVHDRPVLIFNGRRYTSGSEWKSPKSSEQGIRGLKQV
jgi:hypothetical protein